VPRTEKTILSTLYHADESVALVVHHDAGIRDHQGNPVAGWVVHYNAQQTTLDDMMEKLTKIPEVLRIVQWTVGMLFVIRKPPDFPIPAPEPTPETPSTPQCSRFKHRA
jgi:hypothetical protein